MLRLGVDFDVHGEIVRGLLRREPRLDLRRARDVLPEGATDPTVLDWSRAEHRVLLTNDRNTMPDHAYRRIEAGLPSVALIVTTNEQSIGSAIEDILLVSECMSENEIHERLVVYLPLRG